jgi:signal transduction histidine kinase
LSGFAVTGSSQDGYLRTYDMKAFPLPSGAVGLAFEDVSLQARARALQACEQRVLEMLASGASLADVLTVLAVGIETQLPRTHASILLLDDDGAHVLHGAAPSLPESFNRAVHGSAIGPAAGSCGTAAFHGKSVFVTDIETDPLWADYRTLASAHGLRACWSVPIKTAAGRVIGTFALYDREPRSPRRVEVEIIERASHVAGIAIQRRRLDEQLRALTAHLETVREDERTGIAREIHDVLGQALTAMKMDIAWLGRRLATSSRGTDELTAKLASMSDLSDEIIKQVRRISADLRPGVLDDLGLLAALEWQAQQFENRTGVQCSVWSNLCDTSVDRQVATAMFRIFQETLTNVARHAQARHVDVRLERQGEELRLEVHDDGKGISLEALHNVSSLGLVGIRERAARLGGRASIGPGNAGGTTVELTLPLARLERGSNEGATR